jgi:hypothetical protein
MSFFASSPHSSELSAFALATVGGIVVFAGLTLEKFSDWLNDRFLGGDKPHKWIGEIGWLFLMIGIAIETGVAGRAAIYELQNKPLNQPASEIKAIAVIDIDSTNTYPALDFSVPNDTYLELLGANIYGESYFGLIPKNFPREFVHKRGFTSDAPISFIGFPFEFEENPVPPFEFDNFTNFVKQPNPPVKEVLDETKQMRFYINFIPKNAQIIGGHVTLEVNGFLKYFTIYKQCTDTNLSAWNPNASGIYLYATNSIP